MARIKDVEYINIPSKAVVIVFEDGLRIKLSPGDDLSWKKIGWADTLSDIEAHEIDFHAAGRRNDDRRKRRVRFWPYDRRRGPSDRRKVKEPSRTMRKGGWTTFDTVEMGDVVAGFEIKNEQQLNFIHALATIFEEISKGDLK